MSCTDCESKKEYTGDGSKVRYNFEFKYMDQSDIKVALWGPDDNDWVDNTDWSFHNITTIEFNTAPPAGTKILIYRCTDIDPLMAQFYPGSSIRAQDLNDNFQQLQLAIEDGRCTAEGLESDKWDKNKGETIYSDDTFECTDDKIPSAGAVCEKIDEEFEDRLVTEEDQKAGRWTKLDSTLNNDEKVASTAAISERHDPFWQDETPTPVPTYRIPGRRWIDTDDLLDKVWDQSVGTWVNIVKAGPQGPKGDEGTFSTVVSDTPPTVRNNGEALQNGDIWFSSELGEAFIWYTQPSDPDSDQWVSISVPGSQGDKGDPGADGFDGTALWVGDTQPTDKDKYPLWFKTTCPTALFAWDDPFWVNTSTPGPRGADGASSYIFYAPLEETTPGEVSFNLTTLTELS